MLAETPDGALWAGTDGGGLSRFDLATERFRTYRAGAAAGSLCGDAVYSLAAVRGGLWVGTLTGVCRLDTATGRFTQPPALGGAAHAAALGLAATRSGTLWIAAGGYGLVRYEPGPDRLTTLAHRPGRTDSAPPGWALAVAEATDGAVWAGFGGGLARVAPDGRVARALDGEVVYALRAGPDGAVWAGTHGGGLALVHRDGRTVRFRPDAARATSLAGADVGAVTVDRTGAVWVGLVGHGLARWSPGAPTFTVAPSAPAGRVAADGLGTGGLAADGLAADGLAVDAIAPGPGGTVWTAGAAGLGRYDGGRVAAVAAAAGTCAQAPSRAVVVGLDGRVWTGGDGLCRLDTATGAWREYRYTRPTDAVGMDDVRSRLDTVSLASNAVYALAVAPDGDVWVGTDEGLNAVDAETGAVRSIRLHRDRPAGLDPSVYAVAAARDGTVWAGTASGLYRYWPAGDRLVRDRHRRDGTSALSGSAVYALHEGDDGTVWAGTEAGLDAVDPATGRIRRDPTVAAEGHPAVRSVAEDASGRLWLATPQGVLRVDVARGRRLAYGQTSGWPGSEPARGALAVTPDGSVLVGTTAGLVRVGGPAADGGPAAAAPLVVTGFSAEGEPLGRPRWAGGHLALPPGTDDLTVRYALLDLTQGRTARYRTRLDRDGDGDDGRWSPPSPRREAAFGGVSPGRYTFRVQAAGPDGRWRAGEARLHIRIAAPWWATVWARAALALLAALALALAYWIRVGRILELAATRRRIADDLHDDIGSKVSTVALRLDLAGRNATLSPETRRQLADLAGSARGVVTDLRDAVWFVDAGHDSLAALVDRVEVAVAQMCAGRAFHVDRPDALPDVNLTMERRRHLFLWVREALHNACKHGCGEIRVAVSIDAGRLGVSVSDSGPGFDTAAATRGRGLTTLAARARALGGASTVESTPGLGTTVRLAMPLRA